MKINKLGTIFLVSILALAGIGISYAGWTDQITVTGTVQTGYVEFDITEYSGTWVWKQISNHGREINHGIPIDYDGDGEIDDDPDGHYGDSDWILVARSWAHNSVEDLIVEFKFENLFPCIDFHADFKFIIGTIPVILTGTELLWDMEEINQIPTPWINGLQGHTAPDVEVMITDPMGVVVYPNPDPQALIQLHPNIEYTWDLKIHIPQDNAYMNAYAEGECTLNIIQWTDDCFNQLLPKIITIPTGPFTMTVFGAYPTGWPSYFKTVLTNLPAGTYSPPIAEGAQCVGWCVDNTGSGSTIQTGTPFTTYMYDSYNLPVSLPGGWPVQPWMNDPDWPYVNWIINNKGSATPQQIQAAIWYFVDGGYPPYPGGDPVVVGLIDGALNNPDGSNYVPPAGQTPPALIAAIMWVDASVHGQKQTTIIEVDP